MEKLITIGTESVKFKASAATVRIYRQLFQRDLLVDMTQLINAGASGSTFTGEQLEIFENFAYTCARQADPEGVPATPDEWLDGFEMLDIYDVLPELIGLWTAQNKTLEETKKKADQLSGD